MLRLNNFRSSLIFAYIHNNQKLIQDNLNDKKIYVRLKFHIKIVLNNVELIMYIFELCYLNSFNNNYSIFIKLLMFYDIIQNVSFFNDNNHI